MRAATGTAASADEAFAQSAVRGEERRDESDQAHAERKHESNRSESEKNRVVKDRSHVLIEALLGAWALERQRPAQSKHIERCYEEVAHSAEHRKQPIALLRNVARRSDSKRIGHAHHGVVERKHRLAAICRREVEKERAAYRHLHRACHAHDEAPGEERHRSAHQQKARQHGGSDERRRKQQRAPADAVAPGAEHRREQAAQQVLAQEGEPDRGEGDAGLVHEVDSEERHQAHAGGDREKIRRDDDPDSSIYKPQ
jgi:hypothetical protein